MQTLWKSLVTMTYTVFAKEIEAVGLIVGAVGGGRYWLEAKEMMPLVAV